MSQPFPAAGNNPVTPKQPAGNPQNPPRPLYQPHQPNLNPPYVPISDEKRERRHQGNLCMRCGKSGHYSTACPNRQAIGRAVFTLEEGEEDLQEGYEVEEEVEEDADQELPGEV